MAEWVASLRIYWSDVRILLQHKAHLVIPAQKDENHQGANPQPTDSAPKCPAALIKGQGATITRLKNMMGNVGVI